MVGDGMRSSLCSAEEHTPPEDESTSSSVKLTGWGHCDTEFRLNERGNIYLSGSRYSLSNLEFPLLKSFAEQVAGINFEEKFETSRVPKIDVPASVRCELFAEEMNGRLPGIELTFSSECRVFHSRGHSLRELWALKTAKVNLPRLVDAVCYPTCHDDVQVIIDIANKLSDKVALIPFGGGTSVTLALLPPAEEERMIISVDTSRMSKVLWVDRENSVACVEAGAKGKALEEELNKYGFTLGHQPDSWEFSTAGGWVSTRCSGMKKNTYGNIEDILVNVKAVCPSGTFTLRNGNEENLDGNKYEDNNSKINKNGQWPRISCGPDLRNVILGSEGNFGIVTEVMFKLRRKPEVVEFTSIVFPSFEVGIQCLRELSNRQLFPTSIRLVDNAQFIFSQSFKPLKQCKDENWLWEWYRNFKSDAAKFYVLNVKRYDRNQLCAATMLLEGTAEYVRYTRKATLDVAALYGGLESGSGAGKMGYFLTFVIAYIRDFLFEYGFFAESFETTVPWSQIMPCYRAVTDLLENEVEKLGIKQKAFTSCRVSQIYDHGVCLYFYFGFNFLQLPNDADPIVVFEHIEDLARHEIIKLGGSVSHHHGVGKSRKKYYQPTVTKVGVDMIKALKQKLDPTNLLACGNLV